GKFFLHETEHFHWCRTGRACKLSHIPPYAHSFTAPASLLQHKIFRFLQICFQVNKLKISFSLSKQPRTLLAVQG
ncbi:hypothetical protein, partial [Erwinia amylovora]|uniref:hypothetical protein n=1 Tax=Erwinia amylovora TaxID=552 RepID=UPI0020BE067E